jgi:hypothetical protein
MPVMRSKTLFFILLIAAQVLAQPSPSANSYTVPGLEGVTFLRSFANDAGMVCTGLQFEGKDYDLAEADELLLPKLGWNDNERREELARLWIAHVVNADNVVLTEPMDTSVGHLDCHPPKAELLEDGSVQVKIWLKYPVRMRPEETFIRVLYTFNPDGTIVDQEALETHRIGF